MYPTSFFIPLSSAFSPASSPSSLIFNISVVWPLVLAFTSMYTQALAHSHKLIFALQTHLRHASSAESHSDDVDVVPLGPDLVTWHRIVCSHALASGKESGKRMGEKRRRRIKHIAFACFESQSNVGSEHPQQRQSRHHQSMVDGKASCMHLLFKTLS